MCVCVYSMWYATDRQTTTRCDAMSCLIRFDSISCDAPWTPSPPDKDSTTKTTERNQATSEQMRGENSHRGHDKKNMLDHRVWVAWPKVSQLTTQRATRVERVWEPPKPSWSTMWLAHKGGRARGSGILQNLP